MFDHPVLQRFFNLLNKSGTKSHDPANSIHADLFSVNKMVSVIKGFRKNKGMTIIQFNVNILNGIEYSI